MTPIETAVGRVVARRPGGERKAAAITPRPANDPGHPVPVLPPELQDQVDRLRGKRFGDMVMTMPGGRPVFHPQAADFLDRFRAATEPAAEAQIHRWFIDIARSLAPGAVSADAVFGALLLICGDYPAVCWDRSTARAIVSANKFLPSASEIKEVVQPVADSVLGPLRELERIARADPSTAGVFHGGPARESREVYPVQPPPPVPEAKRSTAKAAAVEADSAEEADPIDPEAAKAQLLAAFGEAAFATDLLAARRAKGGGQ
jgi:hypothetical protein